MTPVLATSIWNHESDSGLLLIVLAVVVFAIYVIRERSSGSERRAARRRRAREILRAERDAEHELASKLPRAVAHINTHDDTP